MAASVEQYTRTCQYLLIPEQRFEQTGDRSNRSKEAFIMDIGNGGNQREDSDSGNAPPPNFLAFDL